METQTLLRVPDLAAAIEPLVGHPVAVAELFRLIAEGVVKPFGYLLRAPVFVPSQVASAVQSAPSVAIRGLSRAKAA